MRLQVRHGEDRYPMGRLILQRAAELGLSRTEVVRRLGYQNADKGHRKLSRLLATGVVPPQIGSILPAALEVEPGTVQAAIAETGAQHYAEKEARLDAEDAAYRTAFRPHLRAEVERAVPTSLFVAIVYGPALRIVPVADEAWTTDDVARRRLINRAIIGHYSVWRGSLPSYGRITGYVAVTEVVGRFDAGVPYGVDGNAIGPPMVVERIGVGALTHLQQGHPMSRAYGCAPQSLAYFGVHLLFSPLRALNGSGCIKKTLNSTTTKTLCGEMPRGLTAIEPIFSLA